jgi:hypothetical protein
MNNPVCVVELRKGLSAGAQGLAQNGTVFDTEFGSKVLIVQGVDCIDDLGVAGR